MSWSEAVSFESADADFRRERTSFLSLLTKALLVLLLTLAVAVQAQESPKGDTAKALSAKKAPVKATVDVLHWLPFEIVRANFPIAPKPLFLYINQAGCDHCAYMDSAVFARPEIARYVNEHLTPVRVDIYMDTPLKVRDTVLDELAFRKLLAIEGIPAYYFFSTDGRIIGVLDSQMDLITFKRMLVFIRDGHFFKTSWNDFIMMPSASEAEVNKRFEGK